MKRLQASLVSVETPEMVGEHARTGMVRSDDIDEGGGAKRERVATSDVVTRNSPVVMIRRDDAIEFLSDARD